MGELSSKSKHSWKIDSELVPRGNAEKISGQESEKTLKLGGDRQSGQERVLG